jgi:hypothetical protein
MLHERHADAADHAADALTADHLRVDDAASSVGAHDAPHARLAEIRIHGDFHEHGAEGVHGESLGLIARLGIRRGLDGLTDATHGLGHITAAAACERILARRVARGLHGAADAGRGERPAVHGCPRQPCVAEGELDPFDRQTEGLSRLKGAQTWAHAAAW